MTTKELAREVIDSLPDNASLDDLMHALYLRAKFERGDQEISDGKGISHEDVKTRMKKWLE